LLVRLTGEPAEGGMAAGASSGHHENPPGIDSEKQPNTAAGLVCPSCNGSLWEIPGDPVPGFECRVGHRFSGEAFLGEQAASVEAAIWSAINSLQERADTLRRVATRMNRTSRLANQYVERATEADAQAETIRKALTRVIQSEALGG
jgi:two-component system chemotaxis response regulator CheB